MNTQIKTYDLFTAEELVVAELIQQRRLQLLVHSCLYYELDTSIVSDSKWSAWAKELAQLQKSYPDISMKVIWADAFADWSGGTGAFLPLRDPWVMHKAQQLLKLKKPDTPKQTQIKPKKQISKSLF
jgi:hypothetical protein